MLPRAAGTYLPVHQQLSREHEHGHARHAAGQQDTRRARAALGICYIERLVPAGGRHGARERGVPDALQLLPGAAEGPLPGDAAGAARAGAVDERSAAGAAAAAALVRVGLRRPRPGARALWYYTQP